MATLKSVILVILLSVSFVAEADTVSNAFAICQAVDSTGALSEECKVSGWNQAVDISLETSSVEAKKFCVGVAKLAAKQNMKFDKGWKIRVYSPLSNGKTIAFCLLPQ